MQRSLNFFNPKIFNRIKIYQALGMQSVKKSHILAMLLILPRLVRHIRRLIHE